MDGLRFFAIVSVVMWHIAQLVRKDHSVLQTTFNRDVVFPFMHIGTIGVPLFFAISGFVLSLPFAEHYLNGRSRPRIGKYYLRRITRLEPPIS
jgi:peptidoglycan/LPS O-acetylase OafA/YrhL